MSFPSFIYRQWLDSSDRKSVFSKAYSFFFKRLRGLMLRFGDPLCKMEVRNQQLWMPFSHLLPMYVRLTPQYDTLVSRVATFIRTSQGKLVAIDVGANIGDTILACAPVNGDRYLAFEPHPIYFACLQRNLVGHSNVRQLQMVCGATDSDGKGFEITTAGGSAQIQSGANGKTIIKAAKLDSILNEQTDFRDSNFLKIDTDGHDFDVIRGARELIQRTKPTVLFECQTFQNPNYVENIVEVFEIFSKTGYREALVYDNVGYLICRLDLRQPAFFAYSLFHQLVTQNYYFDILMLPDADPFFTQELDYFSSLISDGASRKAAKKAVELIKSGSFIGK